jgi:O-antigen/teichoic acid export membrane protein
MSSAITSALGVAYWALAARNFSPDEVGIASVVLSTMILLSSLTQLNGRVALVRFVPQAGADAGRFALMWYFVSALLGVVVGLLFVATLDLWKDSVPSLEMLTDPALGLWFALAIAVWSLFNLQDGLLTGLGRATVVPVENAGYAIAKLLLLLALFASAGHVAIFISWTVPAAAFVVLMTGVIFGVVLPSRRRSPVDETVRLSPLRIVRFLSLDYAAYVLSTATATLLAPVVLTIAGAAQSAYFYIAWVIVTSLMLIPVYLSTSLTVQSAGDVNVLPVHLRAVVRHMARLLLPVAAFVAIFAPWILLVFGPDYANEASTLLRIAAIGLLPYAVNIMYMAVARVQRSGRAILAVQGSLTCLTLGLSVGLLNPMGIAGVGVAWTLANAIVAAIVIPVGLRPLLAGSSSP